MSRYVDLGIFAESAKPFRGDLDIILTSNVLVQANSGGGKSWALRRFIEQAFKRVPQIIIDPEGEFSTLRSHFDIILVGKGGDTPADIRSATLLAHRLLELGTSAVIDLFEMSKPQRPIWVAAFVGALVDAPKALWRDFLIYVDEAHDLAPEPGHGSESQGEKACRHALIDLASKGRKRGYGVVAATQRLGKLSKDFAAELKNVLIGQTFIDIDRERAAGNLGISKANKPAFFQSVMKLEPGAFFAFGRAFVLEPTLVTIGGVQTEHPEAGRRQSAPPPPTDKIRHLLPQLADLPKEAEQKLVTEKELRARIADLERELARKAPAAPPTVTTKTVERDVVSPASLLRIERLITKLAVGESKAAVAIADLNTVRDRFSQQQQAVVSELGNLRTVIERTRTPAPTAVIDRPRFVDPGRVPRQAVVAPRQPAPTREPGDGDEKLPKGALEMLAAVATSHVDSMTRRQVATLSGIKVTGGTFAKYLSILNTGGYLDVRGHDLKLTEKGRARAGDVEIPADGAALLAFWERKVPGAARVMLRHIVVNTPSGITDEDWAHAAKVEAGGGTWAKYKSILITRGLVEKRDRMFYPSELFAR